MVGGVPSGGPVPGLEGLPGLDDVREQLAGVLSVIRAEQARQVAGAVVARRAWKNLVFTGGPGTGKIVAGEALGLPVESPS